MFQKTKKPSYLVLLIATLIALLVLLIAALIALASVTNLDKNPPPPSATNITSSSGSTQSSKAAVKVAPRKPSESSPASSPHYKAAIKGNKIIESNGQIYPLRIYRTLISPNDPYASQWWVTPNNMSQVWDIPTGGLATKVAIIDTGFALSHEEFSGRWAVNQGESGATATQASPPNCTSQGKPIDKSCNRIDDDGNGFVDDWRGWDFSNNDNSAQAGETNPNGDGTKHGTMVAGVLGGSGNNGVGIAGVNWHSSILPIQALNDDSYGNSVTVGNAVYYAADQGADVINISLGTDADDPYLRSAMRYALERGSVVVAAAGNDGCNCMVYPANYPEVIAVGALHSDNSPATFSSFGSQLDILAPGQNMTTSYWTSANQTNAYTSGAAGTSFSAPFVSGLLGLARSYQPDARWEDITGAMFERADRRNLTSSTPRNDQLGFGHTRASTMLDRLRTPNSSVIRYSFSPALSSVVGSKNFYQCQNDIPATLLFELTKPGQLRYTASSYERYQATLEGWNSRSVAYVCMGLPTDTTGILRVINLANELHNTQVKQ